MAKINRDNLLEHLVEKQFNIIDKTILDALFVHDQAWREWSITKQQYKSFEKYTVALMQKVLKIPKKKALEQFNWFNSKYGLKVKE